MSQPVLFLTLATVLMAFSCKTKQAAPNPQPEFDTITLRQGGCFGTCAVYNLTIARQGEATFEGLRYSDRQGLYGTQVADSTTDALSALADEVFANADKLPRNIESGIADLATSTIILRWGSDTLKFQGTTEYAEPIDKIRKLMFAIADPMSSGRTPGADAWKADPNNPPMPVRHLHVELQAADQIDLVIENYFKQKLKMVRMTSTEPPVFLMSFDPYTMSADEMVVDLKRRPQVVSVKPVQLE